MNKHGIMLSVYADDLTFSSDKEFQKNSLLIRSIMHLRNII